MCVLVYARTHTQSTWALDVSLGVGRTLGEPEEPRSTKAQYTCRSYMCTKYICLCVCWAAGFNDLAAGERCGSLGVGFENMMRSWVDDDCFYYFQQ